MCAPRLPHVLSSVTGLPGDTISMRSGVWEARRPCPPSAVGGPARLAVSDSGLYIPFVPRTPRYSRAQEPCDRLLGRAREERNQTSQSWATSIEPFLPCSRPDHGVYYGCPTAGERWLHAMCSGAPAPEPSLLGALFFPASTGSSRCTTPHTLCSWCHPDP